MIPVVIWNSVMIPPPVTSLLPFRVLVTLIPIQTPAPAPIIYAPVMIISATETQPDMVKLRHTTLRRFSLNNGQQAIRSIEHQIQSCVKNTPARDVHSSLFFKIINNIIIFYNINQTNNNKFIKLKKPFFL